MATYNDVTGDALVSRTLTEEGAKSYDRIFGEKKKKTNGGWTPPPLNTDKLVWSNNQDPNNWNSSALTLNEYPETGWGDSEKRIENIGRNSNDGLHYDITS